MAQTFADALSRLPMSRTLAQTMARARGYAFAQLHRRVTLEHLLLALGEDQDAIAVLQASRVDLARLATDSAAFIGRIEDRFPPQQQGEPEADADLIRILEYAAAAAHQSRRREINGAVVMAAIVGDGRSAAANILRTQGLTFEEAIQALQRGVAAPRPQPAPPPPAPVPAPASQAVPPQPAYVPPPPPPNPLDTAARFAAGRTAGGGGT
jgi:ATP-dependent Clp protease ATP-binding subunit ClpA